MPSKKRLIIVFSDGIGLASKFNKAAWPLVRIKNSGSLEDGGVLLQLTLRHLHIIRRVSRDTHDDLPELFVDSKAEYDA